MSVPAEDDRSLRTEIGPGPVPTGRETAGRCESSCGRRGGGFPGIASSDSRPAVALHEERQVGLALAAQEREVDLGAANAAGLGEHDALGLEALRREHAARGLERGVAADALEVAAQLFDRFDRADTLDLDREP